MAELTERATNSSGDPPLTSFGRWEGSDDELSMPSLRDGSESDDDEFVLLDEVSAGEVATFGREAARQRSTYISEGEHGMSRGPQTLGDDVTEGSLSDPEEGNGMWHDWARWRDYDEPSTPIFVGDFVPAGVVTGSAREDAGCADQARIRASLLLCDVDVMLWSVSGAGGVAEALERGARASDAAFEWAAGIVMGSPDPQGVGDEDRVRRPMRVPTFSLAVYDKAEHEELMQRRLPVMNAPECTAPLAAPWSLELSTRLPPVVTSREQVVPRATMKVVGMWLRKFRRCIAAAAKGNFSLARRLRPEDLWLPETEWTAEAARGFVWDFTPLDRGEPARVVEPGPPAGDLVADAVALLGIGHADQGIVGEMLFGFADDADVPMGTLLCAPHVGALRHLEQAKLKVAKSVTKGWAFTYERIPCWPIRAAPYSIVDESERAGAPKFRLTNDLSWPKPGMIEGVLSLNDAMERSMWPPTKLMKAVQLGESAAVLAASGVPVKLWSRDAEAYYRKIGRRVDQIWRQALVTPEGKWQLDFRSQFGDAAVAVKAVRMSDFMAEVLLRRLRDFDAGHPSQDARVLDWQAKRRAEARRQGEADVHRFSSLHAYGQFIDDGGGASIDDKVCQPNGDPIVWDGERVETRAVAHYLIAKEVFEIFGHSSSADKECPPSDVLVFLGVEFSLREGKVRLSARKRAKYASICRELASRVWVTTEEFRSLLGKLTFASMVYPLGRQWLHPCWRAQSMAMKRSVVRAGEIHPVGSARVTRHVREALLLWAAELEWDEHPGVPLASRGRFPAAGEPGVGVVYADASGEEGWSAWTIEEGIVYMVAGVWSEADAVMIIAEKELVASTVGLFALAELLGWKHVWEFTDNTVALSAMRSMTPGTRFMQRLVVVRAQWMMAKGLFSAAERITSLNNLWADVGSRPVTKGGPESVRREAAEMGLDFVDVHCVDWRGVVAEAVDGWLESIDEPEGGSSMLESWLASEEPELGSS